MRNSRPILLILAPLLAFPQSRGPSFEVADVKLNQSGDARLSVDFQPGARFSARNVPMRILIALAFEVRPDAVVGGPGWIGSARYDIVAKGGSASKPADIRRMVQTLLAERFRLAVHQEEKMMSAYALEVSPKGLKAQPSATAPLTEQRCVPADAAPGRKRFICRHLTLPSLAATLQEIAPRDIDVPIVDQTGRPGSFDFDLEWTPALSPLAAPPSDPAAGPTLFDALESQLGLRLQRKKLPLPVIVVDSVERTPLEN